MPCYLRLVLWSRDTYQAIIVYITGCMDRLSHACLTTDWQFSNRSRSSQTDFWVKSTGTNLKERFKVDLFASLSFHNPLCHCLSYTFYEVKKRQCPLLMYPYSLFFAGSGYLRIAHPERTMKKPALIYYWRIEVPSQISWLLETFWKSIIIINVSSFESYGLRSCLGVRHISHLWVCLSVRLQ